MQFENLDKLLRSWPAESSVLTVVTHGETVLGAQRKRRMTTKMR